MKTYRLLWLSLSVPMAVIGATVGFVVSPAGATCLLIVVGVVGSLLMLCLSDSFWEERAPGRLRLLVRGAPVAGAGAGAFVGYASLFGPGVLLIGAAALLTSPYAVRIVGRWLRSARTPSAAQLDAVARAFAYASPEAALYRAPGLHDLSDEQLCRRWRASFRASQRQQSSPVKLIAAVAERQMFLEELERRNSSGFAAWLAAGPGAVDDPLPYLSGHWVEAPAVDWDELTRDQG